MSIITVTTYVIAGIAKLRHGGADWLTGDEDMKIPNSALEKTVQALRLHTLIIRRATNDERK